MTVRCEIQRTNEQFIDASLEPQNIPGITYAKTETKVPGLEQYNRRKEVEKKAADRQRMRERQKRS
jgi:hypothetical protein